MRFGKIRIIAAAVFAALAVGMLSAGEALADRYSATMVYDDGGFVSESKVYVHNNNYRVEPGLSYEPIVIARQDDNVMYKIDQDTGYISQEIFRQSDLPPLLAPPKPESMTSLGEDEFDGVACIKYETEVADSYGNKEKQIRWMDKYVGRLLKLQAEDGSWTYYLKNIELGSQDPALFEVPVEGSTVETGEEDEEYGEYGDEEEDTGSEYDEEDEDYGEDYGEYGDEYEEGEE